MTRRKTRIVFRRDLIGEAKKYKPNREFKIWLKKFLKEDSQILDELAKH